jgi:hypothetical protein
LYFILLFRLIWLVIFFTSAGFFVNQVVKSVIHFTDRPMTVKVEVNFNDSLRFPGVVLCNQNTFRYVSLKLNCHIQHLSSSTQAYLGYCVIPSSNGLLYQDTSLRDRVEKSCWTSLA